jgi:ribosome biogenesis GTPase
VSSPSTHPLAGSGWDTRVARIVDGFGEPGRVVRVEYGAVVVRTVAGERIADWTARESRAAGIDSSPAVGDWVDIAATEDGEGHVVVGLADRWSSLVRHDPADDHAEQVLAANVDVIFVVAAADRPLNIRRLDRMLALAWGSGARPVLVLTKTDLAADSQSQVAAQVAGRADWLEANGLTGDGIEALRAQLGRGTAVFLGPSGVGKSTLVNALSGTEVMETADVRDRDGKGRHTTTTRELWPVPGGGVVIDTPGIRGVQLWDPEQGVDAHFGDLAELAERCRFGDCAHRGEPGCAVVEAVEAGSVTADRVGRWLDLRAEADEWAQRQVEHDRSKRRGGGRRSRS